MTPKVVHFEIMGKQGSNNQDFYKNVFGWEINTDNPMNYGVVSSKAEGSIGGGVAQGDNPYVTFYIEVDDLQKYLNKVEELGGKTVVGITEIPNMVTFAMFEDVDGNMIGLVKSSS